MSTNLGLDDELTTLEGVGNTATGFSTKLIELLRAALKSTSNPFGSAARKDYGTGAGDLVELNSSGKIPPSLYDQGTEYALPQATTTQLGGVEKATSSEMTVGSANKYPDASTIKSYVDNQSGVSPIFFYSSISTSSGSPTTIISNVGSRKVLIVSCLGYNADDDYWGNTVIRGIDSLSSSFTSYRYGNTRYGQVYIYLRKSGSSIQAYVSSSTHQNSMAVAF